MDSGSLIFFAVGVGLGLVTSIPIGVANVAVVGAGLHSGRGRALAIGAGGALADTVQAGAAFAGIGPLLDRYALLPALLFVVSGLAIAGYGVHVMRSSAQPPGPVPGGAGRGVVIGLSLTLLNPAALMAWIIVASALATGSVIASGALALGVGLGAFSWFAVLAHLASRGTDLLTARGTILTRWVGVLLVILGALALGRGLLRLLD